MDDTSPNFVPIDLGLDTLDLTEIRHLRRMPVGRSEGPASQISDGLRKRHTVVEMMFISRAYAVTSAKG
jgi:hypothetical protein